MASTITTVTTNHCERCQGAGTIPTYRSRWIGGSKDGYRSEGVYDVRCDDCNGMGSSEPPPSPSRLPSRR